MAIDVGTDCIDLGSNILGPYTLVDEANAANASGTIDTICLRATNDMSGIQVGVFTDEGANVLTCSAGHYTVEDNLTCTAAASPKTFTSAGCDFTAFSVTSGEYIGIYWSGGNIDRDTSGGTGFWFDTSDQIPAASVTFDGHLDGDRIGLGATGVETPPPTTVAPTSLPSTSLAPTSLPPTTLPPTSLAPTSLPPTSLAPTTIAPTSLPPTSLAPTTLPPTSLAPTSLPPTSLSPTTVAPTSLSPTTIAPTSLAPTTVGPTSLPPTSLSPTTMAPTTVGPTSISPTSLPPTTTAPTTPIPTTIPPSTLPPTTTLTTTAPTTLAPATEEPEPELIPAIKAATIPHIEGTCCVSQVVAALAVGCIRGICIKPSIYGIFN